MSVTAAQEAALAIGQVGPIELAAGISRAREAGTATRLAVAREDTAVLARAAAAAAAPPACPEAADLVVVAEAVDLVVEAEAAGAGSQPIAEKKITGALS